MGYRSEVGLCLNDTAMMKMQHTLQRLKASYDSSKENVENLLKSADTQRQTVTGEVAYYWSSLKWYEDYTEVAFLEIFFSGLNDNEYLFIRIGESDDDVEYRGSWWDNPFRMGLLRTITFD